MGAIVRRLETLDLDLIAFQEVWTVPWRAILVDGARRAGLEHVWHNPETVGGGGLLVASRLPIEEAQFHRYTLCGLPERIDHGDYYAGKGFVALRIEGPAAGNGPDAAKAPDFLLMATHLVAQYESDADDIYRGQRVAEIVEAAAFVSASPLPVVALGDFNMQESAGLYEIWKGLAGVRDVAVALDRRQPTVLGANPYRGGDARDERIDYAFVRDGPDARVRPISIEREFDAELEIDGHAGACSDHAGLVVALDVVPGPGARPPPDPVAVDEAGRWLARGRAAARQRRRADRALAGGSLALCCVGAGVAVSRRRFLRAGATGVALLGAGGAIGFATLSERFVPREIDGFARVAATLETLRAAAGGGADAGRSGGR